MTRKASSANDQVIDWLLEDNQPSVRYYTLVDILGRSEGDDEVRQARSNIPKKGWAKDILALQSRGGYWESADNLYRPKYTATNWRAIVLSDLGLTSENPRIKRAADQFFKQWLQLPSMTNVFNDEVCVVGNTARMLTRFGYGGDFRVRKLFDRLVEDQKEDGGWHCFESNVGTLDGWEGLAAFAALPKTQHTKGIKRSVEKGAEFYLQRKLFEEGKSRYEPWFRLHYPNHYYYDILVGLDTLTRLGYSSDKRLKTATEILISMRQSEGSWLLERVHPDIGVGADYNLRGRNKIKPFALEASGKPSKWITLQALRVLKRIEDAN
jgi:hypothetical protein